MATPAGASTALQSGPKSASARRVSAIGQPSVEDIGACWISVDLNSVTPRDSAIETWPVQRSPTNGGFSIAMLTEASFWMFWTQSSDCDNRNLRCLRIFLFVSFCANMDSTCLRDLSPASIFERKSQRRPNWHLGPRSFATDSLEMWCCFRNPQID